MTLFLKDSSHSMRARSRLAHRSATPPRLASSILNRGDIQVWSNVGTSEIARESASVRTKRQICNDSGKMSHQPQPPSLRQPPPLRLQVLDLNSSRSNHETKKSIRGRSQMTSAKFSGFLTPLPPPHTHFSHFSQTITTVVRKNWSFP